MESVGCYCLSQNTVTVLAEQMRLGGGSSGPGAGGIGAEVLQCWDIDCLEPKGWQCCCRGRNLGPSRQSPRQCCLDVVSVSERRESGFPVFLKIAQCGKKSGLLTMFGNIPSQNPETSVSVGSSSKTKNIRSPLVHGTF